MQTSVLVFVLAVMMLAMLFFSFAATSATHLMWPFCAVACAASIGLGLARPER